MNNWFEEWFDSPLYERLYASRDEKEAKRLINFLEKTLQLNRCSRILDLGCGRGRHALNLAEKGYNVKGIDLSRRAIDTARSKAKMRGLKNVGFHVRDMRIPLPETFDAVVNLFTTFGYFPSEEENKKVLDSVVKMLKKDGIFVLDYLNAETIRDDFDPAESGIFKDGIEYSIRRYIKNGAIRKDIEFYGDRLNGVRRYTEHVKLYTLEWFEREFSERGLKIDHIYGGYDGKPFDPEQSNRLLLISRLVKKPELNQPSVENELT